MAFKDMLLVAGEKTDTGNRYALWLAGACGATLTAVAPVADPILPGFAQAEMPSDLLFQVREDAETAARRAIDAFSTSAKQSDVIVETLTVRTVMGDVGGEVSRLARYFDVTVLQQPETESTSTAYINEAVVFGSGRPVIMVPYIDVPTQLKTVLIAWDGGRPAARAVGDALPLLMMADRVEVITVTDTGRDEYSPAERITRHLARHGIKATSARYPRDSLSTANALLSYAAEANADLMVMGGYGHSRLREFVLGSTTRKILQTMTVPVLMAH